MLDAALNSEAGLGHPFVQQILVAMILGCRAAAADEGVVQSLDAAFTCQWKRRFSVLECADTEGVPGVADHPGFTLEKIAATACQSLLFQIGGRHHQEKHFLIAAKWFELCTHPSFRSAAGTNQAKCLRKTALCYIEAGQHAKVAKIVARCPANEAGTHYVAFLCAAYQGIEDEGSSSPVAWSHWF